MSNKVLFKSKSDITNFFNSEANQSREIKDGDLTNIKQLKLNNLEETLLNFCLKANQKILELAKSMENLKKHNVLGEGEEGVGGGANASGNGGGERSSNPQQERGRAREREERGREEWDVSNNFKHKFNRLNNRLDYLESQVDENATRLRFVPTLTKRDIAYYNLLWPGVMVQMLVLTTNAQRTNLFKSWS